MTDDTDLFRRLLHRLDDARDAATDILASHRDCGCQYCREVGAIGFCLELFENALNCRSPVEDVAD